MPELADCRLRVRREGRLAATGDGELVLGVPDALLDRQRSALDSPRSIASSSACAASSWPCALASSIFGRVDGVVDERDRPVVAAPGRSPAPVANSSTSAPSPGWIRVEPAFSVAIERRMAGEHADLADLPGHDDHLRLALERRPVRRDERDVNGLPLARH